MKQIKIEIQTPVSQLYIGEADSIVLPTLDGLIGVLPGHVSLVTLLGKGTVQVKSLIQNILFDVEGGFVEINPTGVSILANYAQMVQS